MYVPFTCDINRFSNSEATFFALMNANGGKYGCVDVKGTYIDKEQLLLWNPDIVFIDETGLNLSLEDLKTGKGLDGLKALQNGKIYILLPYNNYSVNYETVLINSWFIGKMLYPQKFSDVEIGEKGNEISTMFFGKQIFDKWLTEYSFNAIN
jgi:iron complex transport system substrate-binding protein